MRGLSRPAPRLVLVVMNWLDAAIVVPAAAGLLYGAHRGVLRQVAMLAAFYASLVMAARYYAGAADLLVTYVPQADRSMAGAYALAGITAAGTLGLSWLSHSVYRSTALSRAMAFDRLAGAGLGLAWSWAVVAFAVTVLAYSATFSWGTRDAFRRDVTAQIEGSGLVGLVRGTLPVLRDIVAPWLPRGLPVPFVTS